MAALKDLQEKRQALAVQIRELGNKQAEWTAEHEATWGTLNTEYDAIQAAMTAERERLAKDESVQKRLAEIEETNKRALEDGRVGLDAGRRREENPERVEKIDTRAIAMQAWLRAGKGIDLTEEHRDVCRKAGVNPYSPEFNPVELAFRHVQRFLEDHTEIRNARHQIHAAFTSITAADAHSFFAHMYTCLKKFD